MPTIGFPNWFNQCSPVQSSQQTDTANDQVNISQTNQENQLQAQINTNIQNEEQQKLQKQAIQQEEIKQNTSQIQGIQNTSTHQIDTTVYPEDINKLENQFKLEQESTKNLMLEIKKLQQEKSELFNNNSKDFQINQEQLQLENLQQNSSQYISDQEQQNLKKIAKSSQFEQINSRNVKEKVEKGGKGEKAEDQFEYLKNSSVFFSKSGIK
eukprot:TRINITY_DN3971_c0_g1_i15.p3 TRINITY_DN3971_c0_g1~~TRINITY_DN3971_c0_g1_i15.p3  ORF type:complete len:211 (-),score=44.03 TRINITY_DN3971_c0_g1_i15:887-1519(-)